jgi:hypothetical protein
VRGGIDGALDGWIVGGDRYSCTENRAGEQNEENETHNNTKIALGIHDERLLIM